MTNSKPKRRWYQFSLRTLLLVMMVFCVWVGVRVNWARNNRASVAVAVTAIELIGRDADRA
jgi:hypothetical protein